MKKILFALILCFPLSFFAQISASKANIKPAKIARVTPTVYAEIVLTSYSPEKQKVTVVFGDKDERSMKYSKAANLEFISFIDALNAMSLDGYKLVDSYEIEGEKITENHFIMAKEMVYPTKSNSSRTSSARKK